MNAPFNPAKPEPPLTVEAVERLLLDADEASADGSGLMLTFNRAPTDEEVAMYERLPALPQMLADTQQFGARMQAAELVCRLFRFYVLANIVLPDTPAAMNWLGSYIDGTGGHGPLGGPLRWPGMCPSACNILTRWGYAEDRGFVAKKAAG